MKTEKAELKAKEYTQKAEKALDYFDNNSTVFFYDFDRLVNAQESTDRENMGMYKKAVKIPMIIRRRIIFDGSRGLRGDIPDTL